jgi:hypothetical protein
VRTSFLVAGFLFLSGAFSPTLAAASPVPEPGSNVCPASCYPKLTCEERLQRFTAHGCPIPVKVTNNCDEQDRKIGALEEQVRARPVKCPPVVAAAVAPPRDCETECHELLGIPVPKEDNGLLGPTAGYANGPFLGLSGGYQFGNPKIPAIIGTVAYHWYRGGSVNYTPPAQPDPVIPYPGKHGLGAGVSLLWRIR